MDDLEFAADVSQGVGVSNVRFEPLWPPDQPRRYGDWSYTINGNSVTFKLVYGEFSMLFTGDHNEESEHDLLQMFRDSDRLEALRSDVLKVRHDGSRHSIKAFFDAVNPVVSVASMGSRGFRSDWNHPSMEVIRWLGGPHRVYHTFIHERRFLHTHLADEQARNSLIETAHVLIETDGQWFRIVEIQDPTTIPNVRQTRRGNGTRWIRARE
jgi:hypothetical protein